MRRFIVKHTVLWTVAGTACGCSAIDITRINPPSASATPCTAAALPAAMGTAELDFALPPSVAGAGAAAMAAVPAGGGQTKFQAYLGAVSSAKSHLPAVLQDDPVADTVFQMIAKHSASAQIALAMAKGTQVPRHQIDEVNAYQPRGSLSLQDLKTFSDKAFDQMLQPVNAVASSAPGMSAGIAPIAASAASQPAGVPADNLFAGYFSAYYNGTFVDRMGQKLTPPALVTDIGNKTIPDSDITSAVTFLLEYVADLFDTTPVLGDTNDKATAKTFYPSGKTDEPTALAIGHAPYAQIQPAGCGLNANTVELLGNLANAAGTRASAISGLVAQSAGGIGISLGVFGKISIGDNQLLANLVKATASRLAMRATFAAMYGVLKNADIRTVAPAVRVAARRAQ